MSTARVLLVLGFVILCLPRPTAAQQGRITVDLAPASVTFQPPGITDFDTGWIDHPGVTVSVVSRPQHVAWELRLHATDAGLGGYGKPLADLLWRQAGSSAWTPLTETDAVLLQTTGDADITIYFRLLLDWEADLPGSYSTGLSLTAARP